jgi:hypothetical protein
MSKRLFRAFTEDKPLVMNDVKRPKVTIAPSNISVEVLNSTDRNGFASAAAQDLAKIGFQIAGTGNSPAGSDAGETIVRYGPSRADSAKTVAAAIPGSTLRLDDSFGNGLQVLLGTDYTGTRQVRVASSESGSLGTPRTADQDICS